MPSADTHGRTNDENDKYGVYACVLDGNVEKLGKLLGNEETRRAFEQGVFLEGKFSVFHIAVWYAFLRGQKTITAFLLEVFQHLTKIGTGEKVVTCCTKSSTSQDNEVALRKSWEMCQTLLQMNCKVMPEHSDVSPFLCFLVGKRITKRWNEGNDFMLFLLANGMYFESDILFAVCHSMYQDTRVLLTEFQFDQNYVQLDSKDEFKEKSLLMHAIECRNKKMVLLLLECGVNPNLFTADGGNALSTLMYFWDDVIFDALMEYNLQLRLQPDSCTNYCFDALCIAPAADVVDCMVAHGFDLNTDWFIPSQVMERVISTVFKSKRLLLRENDVDDKIQEYNRYCGINMSDKKEEFCSTVQNCETRLQQCMQKSLAMWVANVPDVKLLKRLHRLGLNFDIEIDFLSPVLVTIMSNLPDNLEAVISCLQKDGVLHKVNWRNMLKYAILSKNVKTTQIVFRVGSVENQSLANSAAYLVLAIRMKNLDMIRLILSMNVDVEQVDDLGSNALLVACFSGFSEGVEILLNASANPNARASCGNNVLLKALHEKVELKDEIVRNLLSFGLDVTTKCAITHKTCMEYATECNNSVILSWCHEHGIATSDSGLPAQIQSTKTKKKRKKKRVTTPNNIISVQKVEAESAEITALQECVVCLEAEKTHVLVPCGHVCLCETCARDLQNSEMPECPLCRQMVERCMKVYW